MKGDILHIIWTLWVSSHDILCLGVPPWGNTIHWSWREPQTAFVSTCTLCIPGQQEGSVLLWVTMAKVQSQPTASCGALSSHLPPSKEMDVSFHHSLCCTYKRPFVSFAWLQFYKTVFKRAQVIVQTDDRAAKWWTQTTEISRNNSGPHHILWEHNISMQAEHLLTILAT